MVDVLSTFLLQVTTVHSIDHDGMVKTSKGFRVLALPSICRILHATHDMRHTTCGILPAAYYMRHITRGTPYAAYHTRHITRGILHATYHMRHTIYHIDINYTIWKVPISNNQTLHDLKTELQYPVFNPVSDNAMCYCIQYPFEPFSNRVFWNQVSRQTGRGYFYKDINSTRWRSRANM